MCYFAIMVGKNRKYMLVKFHVKSERDTFLKHNAYFRAIDNDSVRKYIDPKVFHLCNGSQRVVFDNNGTCVAKINNLYKSIFAQPIDRPEDSLIPNMPIAKRRNIIDATTTLHYNIIE